MINNLDKDSKKPNCFLFSISQVGFRDLFWEKQSLFIMTFIVSNFFPNSSEHKASLHLSKAVKVTYLCVFVAKNFSLGLFLYGSLVILA